MSPDSLPTDPTAAAGNDTPSADVHEQAPDGGSHRPAPADDYAPLSDSEIVIGLVYGSGTDVEPFLEALGLELQGFAYETQSIRPSEQLDLLFTRDAANPESPDWVTTHQELGDKLRQVLGNAAMAKLAMAMIGDARKKRQKSGADERLAWVVRSLKRPEEVKEFRRVYGARFILMSLHIPEATRLKAASRRLQRTSPITGARFDVKAVEEIARDLEDAERDYGQNMRHTFPEADFFVDAGSPRALTNSVSRVVQVIFGDPFATPTRHEHAMSLAYQASLRSAEMGRQVGAAITTRSGEVIAVGTNEVPTAGGGQYWGPADPDGRDFAQYPSVDSSDDWKRRVVREMLKTLGDKKWIVPNRRLSGSQHDEKLVTDVVRDLRRTRLHGLVEFGRALHAEMSALLDAARRGVSVQDATLYCTTFPCHNCTRGVIAAGIRELYFVHPYAKSLAEQLHSDSVAIDPEQGPGPSSKVLFCQFLGVAPRGYPFYFQFSRDQRKHEGQATALSRTGIPRVLWENDVWAHGGPPVPADAITIRERDTVSAFDEAVRAAKRSKKMPK